MKAIAKEFEGLFSEGVLGYEAYNKEVDTMTEGRGHVRPSIHIDDEKAGVKDVGNDLVLDA